ncbi:MAG: tetratricopeptide repeat protein [Candidatus Dadabacteria bacterium]|nr:MAG: tetratricopeptide repeat protein [Candidatus Dadabacteria bacterium]
MTFSNGRRLGAANFLRLGLRLLLAHLLAGGAVLGGCHGAAGERRLDTIVLVTIDTWRRDASGFLGGRRPSPTPFLDRLAEDAVVAEDAVAPVPLTGPSHLSMLSCRWPWKLGVRNNGDVIPNAVAPLLPQVLAARGWRTAAFVSASVLDHRLGFARGFEHYDDEAGHAGGTAVQFIAERPADETVGRVLAWVRERVAARDRLFLWVHVFDPHYPYRRARSAPTAREAYEAEVRFADSQIERLYEGLAELGRAKARSLWVVLGDHGEGLGEHGEATHGLLLHGATIRIPFLIHGPGRRGRLAGLVTTVDVMPTVLRAVGLRLSGCDGRDVLGEPPPAGRLIPLESVYGQRAFGLSPAIGARMGPWLWESSPADHLWNVARDDMERDDVAARHRSVVAKLRAEREKVAGKIREAAPLVSRELRERLRSLGYLGGTQSGGRGDLRRFAVEGLPLYARIVSDERLGNLDEAERGVQAFLRTYPRAAELWLEAGFIAVRRGRLADALERFERASELAPEDPRTWLNLGNAAFELGSYQRAEAAYRKTLELDPSDYFALYNLALLLEREERTREAAAAWRQFLREYPNDSKAAAVRRRLSGLDLHTRR